MGGPCHASDGPTAAKEASRCRRAGDSRQLNAADSECEPWPRARGHPATGAVPTQTSARERRSHHSARPTHYPFHVRTTAHPLHLLRDPAPLAKRARRMHVNCGRARPRDWTVHNYDRNTLTQVVQHEPGWLPCYAHPNARSRYELTYMHTATGRDSDATVTPGPTELEPSHASLCSFLGNVSSAYAIANWRSSSPGSLTPRSTTHCIFETLQSSHPPGVSPFHPPGLLLGTFSFSSPSPGSGPLLARLARRLRPSGAAPSGHVPDSLAYRLLTRTGQPHLPHSPRA